MHIEPVRLGLARNAPPDARQCLAPRFGDGLAALLTGEEALSLREPTPRPFDSAVDRRIDLILHGAVLRPTDRHGRNIRQERTVSRRRGSGALLRVVQPGLSCPMWSLGEPFSSELRSTSLVGLEAIVVLRCVSQRQKVSPRVPV